MLREWGIHIRLQHKNIVRLYDVFTIGPMASLCMVMEFCPGSDLGTYLELHGALPEVQARDFVIQIAAGLSYLNDVEPPVIHYDLKPGISHPFRFFLVYFMMC